jgi:ribosome-binding protein aMBF1 (putative translation factor)
MSDLNKKIADLASQYTVSNWAAEIEWRKANKSWIKKSTDIALRILDALDDLGWNKARLAKEMGVSPQQVSKYVRGEENFKLETICKLEQVLGVELLRAMQADEIVVAKTELMVVNEPPAAEYGTKEE